MPTGLVKYILLQFSLGQHVFFSLAIGCHFCSGAASADEYGGYALNAITSLVAIDLQHIRPSFSDHRFLQLSRCITVGLIIPAILVAAQGYRVLKLFLIADLICSGAAFPLFYGLYNKAHNGKTARRAVLWELHIGILLFQSGQLLLNFVMAVAVSVLVSVFTIQIHTYPPPTGGNIATRSPFCRT